MFDYADPKQARQTTTVLVICIELTNQLPTGHKRLCVKTLFDRAQLYCSDGKTLALEHSYLFRGCGYPLSFIRRAMRRKIPRDHGQRENLTPEVLSEYHRTNQDSEPRWATLPYSNGISETLARHLRSHNINVAHKPTATLRTTLVKTKDAIPLEAKAGVIYQFPCKECNSKYVGETGNTLKTRMKQVRNRNMSYLTAVHSLDTGHQFAFDEAKIIGQAQTKAGRLFIEAIYSDENSINRHITLDPCYALIKEHLTK